jgi:drug/metabolite transporter (DMT)-like permease
MMVPVTAREKASPGAIWAALITVYVVWGSTYLAIAVAIETLPPLLMAAVRFLIAGALLYVWAIRRGDRRSDRPTRAQWGAAAIVGTLLLLGGNGLVVLAERTVPSGIAALLVATVPLWMVLIGRTVLRERVTWLEAAGVLIGFGGIVLLVQPAGGEPIVLSGAFLLVAASLSWAAGSMYARRAPLPSRPLVGTAMQMLAGGVALLLAGIARGELAQIHPSEFSLASLLGLAYLIVFGSWLGFSAYTWLLRVTRTSLAATYAYVNPVVAVLLGWMFLREPITVRTVIAGAVIVVAVALIVSARARVANGERKAKRAAEAEPAGTPQPADVVGTSSERSSA